MLFLLAALALGAADERYLVAHRLTPRDIRGVVPISAFYWVEREGVARDRPKTVRERIGRRGSTHPAHHLRAGLPPMLLMYADGDEPWRRQQNVEMAAAVKAAGNARVDLVQIRIARTCRCGRSSVWTATPRQSG